MSPRARLALAAAATLVAAVAVTIARALHANGGAFAYSLDDAYIHLALARNLAATGVLGLEPGVHASASSSPLYTFVLAAIALVAPDRVLALAPLALNAGCAVALLVVLAGEIDAARREAELPLGAATAAAIAAPVTLGLVGSVMMGMETTLFTLLCVTFVRTDPGDRRASRLVVLAAIPLLRPEGLFLVVAALVDRVLRRDRGGAARVLAALGPWLLHGLWNRAHGDAFLPNSVIMHGGVPYRPGEGILAHVVRELMVRAVRFTVIPSFDGALVASAVVVIALATLAWVADRADARAAWPTFAFLVACTLHAAFSSTAAPLGRYQVHLLALGALAALRSLGPARAALGARRVPRLAWIACGAMYLAAHARTIRFQLAAWRASHEIFAQQLQMARFLASHVPDGAVVANDVGAIAFHRRAPLLDVCGLGSSSVRALAHEGRFDAGALDRLATEKGARVAVIYGSWVPLGRPGLCGTRPPRWREVATWSLPQPPIAAAGATVTFFSVAGDPEPLARALRAFEPSLPAGVRVAYAPPASP